MAYSAIVKPSVNFNTKLYTGNYSSGHAITGVGFQPDFTWIKDRSDTSYYIMTDAVRGATKTINSNTTNAEITNTEHLQSFNSDGFTVGQSNALNQNGISNVSWNWKANGQGSSNTDGSINTTYTSVNTTAGFSISSYTGTGSNATVGHGLGVAPKMVIVKNRNGTQGWGVYHSSVGAGNYLQLNDNAAEATASTFWNNTTPTNQVFSIGTSGWVNNSGENYIAYCFAEKKGYSKISSYTGDGNANGPFVYTGFKPAFLLIKSFSNSGNWHLADNTRVGFNPWNYRLQPQDNNAEYQGSAIYSDFLSNGFNLRNSDTDTNGSGRTYMYIAIAEEPLVANSGTDGVPATAR